MVSDTKETSQGQFALQQHNKSLGLMRKYINGLQPNSTDADVLVVLVACLLFFTYEAFAGQDAKAALHLRTGLKIIHERRRPAGNPRSPSDRHIVVATSKPKCLFDVLVQTFIRLDSDYTLTSHDDPYLYPICEEPMPARFSDPDEASLHLEVITAKIFDYYDDLYLHTQDVLGKQRDLSEFSDDAQDLLVIASLRTVELDDFLIAGMVEARRSLDAWMASFAAVTQTPGNRLSHISTQVFYFCVWIWSQTWRDPTATLADRYGPQFEYFTGLCEQYVESHIANTPLRSETIARGKLDGDENFDTPPAFSLGSGVVTCLIAIVEKCRNSSIRRRCIATLRKINLQGLSNTAYLAAYLTAIVEYEEQSAILLGSHNDTKVEFQANEIPEAARFLEVGMAPAYHSDNFDFYKSEQVSFVYVTHGSGELVDELLVGEQVVSVSRTAQRGSYNE
ncbi:hypothetical protein MBLNU13_g10454t1 [Cladosporium sp. NU13]